jgi:cytochrome c biogenesis protein
MKISSSTYQDNLIWRFFSSVRLAVFLLITLAITSIVGTVIPQGEPLQFYLEAFGPKLFKIIKIFKLHNTYHSWWYLTILGLFSTNLVVCTLRRLPFTLKLYRLDNLALDSKRLLKMPYKKNWEIKRELNNDAIQSIVSTFRENTAGKIGERSGVDGGRLFLAERGKWSYWGIYCLHGSILIIFLGALVGLFMGFKGSVMLPEGDKIDRIVNAQTGEQIPLGFSVRCDRFYISFYDNGAPKEYRSDLTVLNDDKEVLHKSIVVNDPLVYKGVTFYQASYRAIPEVILQIFKPEGVHYSLVISAFQKALWPEEELSFGLMQYLPDVHGRSAAQIWIGDQEGLEGNLWLLKGNAKEFKSGGNIYRISLADVKQKYLTGLQVKKDPGVWIVWLGCIVLIVGFGIVFWVPHRRIWLWISSGEGKTSVILSGHTNKNKLQFEKEIRKIENVLNSRLGAR